MEPTILARTHELEATERFLDAAAGGPTALVLAGPAGIGKTTLWRSATAAAARRGYRVLSARPTEAEVQLSYAALTDLVGTSFDDTRSALPPAQERALAAALLRESADEAADVRIIATALTAVLETLAAEAPSIVAVDDVQWLDAASRRALEFAVRRLTGRVGVLVTERADAVDIPPLGLHRALPEERVEMLLVGPLSMAALHHLVGERLGTPPPRSVLARIAETSGGNPFFALELARTAPARADAAPLSLPPSLRELVEARIQGLSQAARDAALAAATITRPTAALVARAVGGDATAALEEAEAAGILEDAGGQLLFSHPLLAAALDSFATPAQRRRLHRHLADIVGNAEERARHLAASILEPDEQIAEEIERAADGTALRGAQDAAFELYAAAARLTPDASAPELGRRLLGGAAAANAVGDFGEARALAERALEHVQGGPLRAKVLTFLAGLEWFGGKAASASALVEQALDDASDDQARGAIYARLARFNFAHDLAQALEYADAGLRLLSDQEQPAVFAHLLIDRFFGGALRGLGAAREVLDRGLALEERAGQALPDGPQPTPLIWFHCVDELELARERHAFEDSWYRLRGEEVWIADRVSHLAVAELHAGNSELAERYAETACAAVERLTVGGPRMMVFEKRCLVDAHTGRVDRARATLVPMIEQYERAGARWWATLSLSTLGLTEFAAGEAAAADDAWRRMHAHAQSVGAYDILFDRSEPFHVELLVASGELDAAREALARLERRGRVLPRPWIDQALPRTRALVLAAEGEHERALALLDDPQPQSTLLPFEAACTLLVKGRLRRRLNRKLAAAEALREAFTQFESIGARPWADRAREELARVGLRHGAPDELTAGERKVAELAASGLTNREVAEAAFMSPKTVEANLARVYRKLGIRSRAELGARLALERRESDAQT